MIVVQYSDIPNDPLLAVSRDWHSKQAEKHGYGFLIFTDPLDKSRHPYWQKPLLLRRLLREGHTDIVWLDTDALWLGDPLDPDVSVIGATECFHPDPSQNHHNAGVLYVKSALVSVIDEWINEPDDGHPWGDNWALKKLIDRKVIQVTTLHAQWNSIEYYPAYRSLLPPKVVAWHGYPGDRVHKMSDYLKRYRSIHAAL